MASVPVATGRRHRAAAGAAGGRLLRRGLNTDRAPEMVLAGVTAVFAGVFAFLTWRQQSDFGTFGFDLGIHSQAIWLAAHGHRLFDTIRGLYYFGENVNLISMVFVPLFWLGAGPHALILVHTLALAAGGVPLWLLARDRTGSAWLALVAPVAYFLYPTLSFMAWWEYHPDTLAILPLLFAWWFATRRRWGWFAASAAIALSCKEDVGLALVGMGIALVAWRGPDPPPEGSPEQAGPRRRWEGRHVAGLAVAVAGAAWFEIATRVIIPANNAGRPPFYESFFWSFGTTPTQVAWNAIRHPSRLLHLAEMPSRRAYFAQMLAPVGLLFVLALPVLVIGLPQLVVNVMDQGEALSIDSQYGALVLVGVFLATVEALGYLHRRRPRWLRAACAWLVVTSVTSAVAWGITPLGVNAHGYWASGDPIAAELRHALRLVPAGAGVSVSYELTAHVSNRVHVFEFPNPWVNVNWLSKVVRERPSEVTWLVVDRAHDTDPALLARLTGPGGPFRVVYHRAGVVAARRVAPGSG